MFAYRHADNLLKHIFEAFFQHKRQNPSFIFQCFVYFIPSFQFKLNGSEFFFAVVMEMGNEKWAKEKNNEM